MYGHVGCRASETLSLAPDPGENSATIQEIFQATYLDFLACHRVSATEAKVLKDILTCRTSYVGGNFSTCPACGNRQFHYNSCGNRNCPTCQWLSGVMWTRAQVENYLPVLHHQTTFTLPAELRKLAISNQNLIYNLIVTASGRTLMELIEQEYGIITGVSTVLHTWTREMLYHPHAHNSVPCGGLSVNGNRWIPLRESFLLPYEKLQAVFKNKVLDGIVTAYEKNELQLVGSNARFKFKSLFLEFIDGLRRKKWIVHNEPPVGKKQPVAKYLASYIRRITISNSRIKWFRDGLVCFTTRKDQTVTIGAVEFMRRYLNHLLPKGFHKIRHFGLYSRSCQNTKLSRARSLVPEHQKVTYNLKEDAVLGDHECWEDIVTALTGKDPRRCEKCGHLGLSWHYLGFGYRKRFPKSSDRTPTSKTTTEQAGIDSS